MILDEEVSIKMNSKHISVYRLKGYNCRVGEFTSVKIEDLPRYSKCVINVKCDDCNCVGRSLYLNYIKITENFGKYRCLDCGYEQRKITCFLKYGVDNPTKSKNISNKISENYYNKTETNRVKMINKQKETIFKKYGGWHFNTSDYKEKTIRTSLIKYGCCDYRSSRLFRDKVKNTLMLKYGFSNISLFNKSDKSWFGSKINGIHYNTNLRYQGTYELDFLDRYYNSIDISKIDKIKYEFNNNIRFYYPDFYLQKYNLIIEIKSTYTFNYDIDRNISKKMACEELGYKFIFIIDKKYVEFEELISEFKI